MRDRIRVGIIGLGWGSLVHLPALKLVPEYEVIAVCGQRAERAAEIAARAGVPESTGDWEQLAQRDDLDLIVVAAPVALHYPMVAAAVRGGKHVLCEKPMALNAEEAQAMVEAAEGEGVASAVGYQWRWAPERMAVADLVSRGFLDQPHLAQVSQTAPMWHPSSAAPVPWKLSLTTGGGYLNAVACHELDYLYWLFGEPEAVCGDVRTEFPERGDADDTCAILVRFRNGALGLVTGSAVSGAATPYRFEATGTAGAITYVVGSEGPRGLVSPLEGGPWPLAPAVRMPHGGGTPDPASPVRRQIQATALLLEDWLPRLQGAGIAPVPDFRDALWVQRMSDAARVSAAGGGWVAVGK